MFRNFHTKRWAGIVLIVGGLGMVVGGIWHALDTAAFLYSGARAPGTVIELRREHGAKGLPEDHPIVRFLVPRTGRSVVFRVRIGLWPSPFSVGDTVEVAYDPAAPDRANINSFWTVWLPPAVLILFGVLCFGAGYYTLRNLRGGPARTGG